MAMQNNKLGTGGRQSKREREKWIKRKAVENPSLANFLWQTAAQWLIWVFGLD